MNTSRPVKEHPDLRPDPMTNMATGADSVPLHHRPIQYRSQLFVNLMSPASALESARRIPA
jgi:hypothetical protein